MGLKLNEWVSGSGGNSDDCLEMKLNDDGSVTLKGDMDNAEGMITVKAASWDAFLKNSGEFTRA